MLALRGYSVSRRFLDVEIPRSHWNEVHNDRFSISWLMCLPRDLFWCFTSGMSSLSALFFSCEALWVYLENKSEISLLSIVFYFGLWHLYTVNLFIRLVVFCVAKLLLCCFCSLLNLFIYNSTTVKIIFVRIHLVIASIGHYYYVYYYVFISFSISHFDSFRSIRVCSTFPLPRFLLFFF